MFQKHFNYFFKKYFFKQNFLSVSNSNPKQFFQENFSWKFFQKSCVELTYLKSQQKHFGNFSENILYISYLKSQQKHFENFSEKHTLYYLPKIAAKALCTPSLVLCSCVAAHQTAIVSVCTKQVGEAALMNSVSTGTVNCNLICRRPPRATVVTAMLCNALLCF